MTLTNYWWLLIWIVVAGGILTWVFPQKQVKVLGKMEYRWNWLAAIILASPYAIWSMNRSNFGDTEVYRRTFFDVPQSFGELSAYLSDHTKDKGFTILTTILKQLIGNNDKLFFLIIAVFQILCVVYFFRTYSANFLMCMFMFIASTDYLSWMFNGMRQFIAVGIVLLSYSLILKKKYVLAVLLILLAATIHGSALLMLPIIFVIQGKAWNKRTLLMIVTVAIAIVFVGRFTSFLETALSETQYSDMVTNEIWVADNGTSILRVLFYSIPAMLAFVGRKYIDAENSPIINLCVNCALCTTVIYALSAVTSGIYIGRLPIYTTLPGYIAGVWTIDHMFMKESARIVKSILILSYLVFFYYQMHMTWGIL